MLHCHDLIHSVRKQNIYGQSEQQHKEVWVLESGSRLSLTPALRPQATLASLGFHVLPIKWDDNGPNLSGSW